MTDRIDKFKDVRAEYCKRRVISKRLTEELDDRKKVERALADQLIELMRDLEIKTTYSDGDKTGHRVTVTEVVAFSPNDDKAAIELLNYFIDAGLTEFIKIDKNFLSSFVKEMIDDESQLDSPLGRYIFDRVKKFETKRVYFYEGRNAPATDETF